MTTPFLKKIDPDGEQHRELGIRAADMAWRESQNARQFTSMIERALAAVQEQVLAAGGGRDDVVAGCALMVGAMSERLIAKSSEAEGTRVAAVVGLDAEFAKLGRDLAGFARHTHPTGALPADYAAQLDQLAATCIAKSLSLVGGTPADAERAGVLVSESFRKTLDALAT